MLCSSGKSTDSVALSNIPDLVTDCLKAHSVPGVVAGKLIGYDAQEPRPLRNNRP
jgi:hypothetical protein